MPDGTSLKIHEYESADGYHVLEKYFENKDTGSKGHEVKRTKIIKKDGYESFETSYSSSRN
ncbi:hypothetical protein FACS1894166_11200 [Bacilli bacterium]|nr:hypothetical protein FACS1894166_11200 [Bacilli bacterium]